MAALRILKRCLPALMLIAALLLIGAVRAHDEGDGRGVVKLNSGTNSAESLAMLILPRLFDLDAAAGTLLNANASDRALVSVVPSDLPADVVTLKLDERRVWSDGEPVTAYDVLFSLLAYLGSSSFPDTVGIHAIAGAGLVDEHTIRLRFAASAAEAADLPPDAQPLTATCDDLPRTNVFIAHSDALVSTFREFVDQHAPEGDLPSLAAWQQAYREAKLPPLVETITPATSGAYVQPTFDTNRNDRWVPADGTGAAIVTPAQSGDRIAAFIAGETNLLTEVPIEQRAGLRSLGDPDARNFQIAEPPGRESLIILLNLANPERPLPAFHPETGAPLNQGVHPIFGDVRVRRAFQLAIDQQALIDGVLQQSADPLAGLYPPSSWAFDPSLTPVTPNLAEAKSLLDEAGWIEGAGGRFCDHCGTAEDGTPLQISLGSEDDLYALSAQIAEQWGRIGVSVYLAGEDSYILVSETFDAYLVAVGGNTYEDADPDRTQMLTPTGDSLSINSWVVSPLLNYNSYNNSDVTDLLEQARTLSGCDPQARAEIYHQAERVLQDDVPFIPVAAPREFYAAAPEVIGFAPRTGDPLWNVESWVIASVETP